MGVIVRGGRNHSAYHIVFRRRRTVTSDGDGE